MKHQNKIFICSSGDELLNYEVEFIQGNPLKYTHLGKTYAKSTQCLIRRNGFLIGNSRVTKHAKDNDNNRYAYMNSFNKIKAVISKEERINIINQILEYTK